MLKEQESWEARRQKIPLRADVEWFDFEHFKNRYTENEGMAIIEVLVGDSQIALGVSRKTVTRDPEKRYIRTPKPKPNSKLAVDEESCWIQRVRIQSPQLILLLSRLTGHRNSWSTNTPRTFLAPFRCFYYCLQQLKECLKLLQANWPTTETPASPIPPTSSTSETEAKSNQKREELDDAPGIDRGSSFSSHVDPGLVAPQMAVSGDVDSPITLAHLTTFIDFIEKHIVPLWHRASGTNKRKFRFTDLWMAFQPGDLLYSPSANSNDHRSTKMYQTAWRLLTLTLALFASDKPDDIPEIYDYELEVHAYYIDYDGISYVPVNHIFKIKHFHGERDISALDIYPLRFLKDDDKTKSTLREQGMWFRQAIAKKHLSCNGWTLTCGPDGTSSESKESAYVEHIDGDVIIDFVEGYKSEPRLTSLGPSSWKEMTSFDDLNWPEGYDELEISYWRPYGNNDQLESFFEIKEKIQITEWFAERLQNEQVNTRAILKNLEEGRRTNDLDEEDVLLLPCRVIAYAFRERRFVMLDIKSLKNPEASDDVFNDLKIDPSHRIMVESLVKSHLEKQSTQKLCPSINMNQDLIRGKGSGLVILLHGVPGVDEADIFLSRRELGDLKRNALVSVFLRVLEYYSGILFLTTNRVGTLDEAFKSRIHISLYYPPLDKKQTMEIFEVNIKKLQKIIHEKEKLQAELDPLSPAISGERPRLAVNPRSILHYAEWHFEINENTPEQRWNGRQIRNAFQVAYSLAQFDLNNTALCYGNEASDRPTPRALGVGALNWRQFDTVSKAVEKFESYLVDATNFTDGDRARKEAIRADNV
ncbi:hypothetical protein ONZ43_g5833 [Nemania bipapillata]|uniref:Uncharacterized protein n=1 Tax=Nemania bipapillata TaxID=110536 RepID=A0ACC2I641_9PEZI|nr:hypothetical protein ONZ43_g5833 [Nemania bipapillata]